MNQQEDQEKRDLISGANFIREWCNYAHEHPEKAKTIHTALVTHLFDLNNRKGWAENVQFNTDDACSVTLATRQTVWKAINDLVEWGFVKMIYKSSHRHRPSVISLHNLAVRQKTPRDIALMYQLNDLTSNDTVTTPVEQQLGNGNDTSTDTGKATESEHSNKTSKQDNKKTLNNETTKQSVSPDGCLFPPTGLDLFDEEYIKYVSKQVKRNGKSKTIKQLTFSKEQEAYFNEFVWKPYVQNAEKLKARESFISMTREEKEQLIKIIPEYIASLNPEIVGTQYQKQLCNFIDGETYKGEFKPFKAKGGASSGDYDKDFKDIPKVVSFRSRTPAQQV